MRKIVILTSREFGYASTLVPLLFESKKTELVGVIYARSANTKNYKYFLRKARKIKEIGIFGALNGFRMRRWFSHTSQSSIVKVCKSLNVKFWEVPDLRCDELHDILITAMPDIGLSLGNGYIPKKIFTIPFNGFLNIHTELLPDYQNAQSVIWPIHQGKAETGFTIHEVSNVIDEGDILYQDKYEIDFCSTLELTVKKTLEIAHKKVPFALLDICENYNNYSSSRRPQVNGAKFTTPNLSQFIRMTKLNKKNFRKHKS